MDRVCKYIFSNFINTLGSLFSTLFVIMSMVFFIQIARITSYIEISFLELVKLYLFMLPKILLFTLPISFFVALAISLFRLSKENESIVVFTLGYRPSKLAKFFTKTAFLLSFVLIFISYILIPMSEELNENFIEYKKSNINLNIKATEFGQKFGNWFVFVQSKDSQNNEKIYKDIVMYNPYEDGEKLIIADSSNLKNKDGNLELILKNGKFYNILEKSAHIGSYEDMILRTGNSQNLTKIHSIIEYWKKAKTDKKRAKDFAIFTLISLFPLATVLFAISFGLVTYRYETGFIYFGIFTILFGYFSLIMLLSKMPFLAINFVFFAFFIASFFFFKFRVLKRY